MIMRPPTTVMEVGIGTSIVGNSTCTFVRNHVKVEVMSVAVKNSKSGGLFCDRQRCVDIDRGNRDCGCYSMNSRISNIVLTHHLEVSFLGKLCLQWKTFPDFPLENLHEDSIVTHSEIKISGLHTCIFQVARMC